MGELKWSRSTLHENWKEFRNFGSIKCPQALDIQYFTVKARDWTIIKYTCYC